MANRPEAQLVLEAQPLESAKTLTAIQVVNPCGPLPRPSFPTSLSVVSSWIDASENHGNVVNATKCSVSSMRIQNPCT